MLLVELKNVDDSIKYHKMLSPKIWEDDVLKKDVLAALKKISSRFIETLGIDKSVVYDIVVTGSMVNYNYTDYSDIDLHVILKYPSCIDCEAFSLDDCMKAKKIIWNDKYDIEIHGIDVELYVQDVSETFTSDAGLFSVKYNKWVNRPTKNVKVTYNKDLIEKKSRYIIKEIDNLINQKVTDENEIVKVKDKIKKLRKSGLQKEGEFSVENLVFKFLRNNKQIDRLHSYYDSVISKNLSLK